MALFGLAEGMLLQARTVSSVSTVVRQAAVTRVARRQVSTYANYRLKYAEERGRTPTERELKEYRRQFIYDRKETAKHHARVLVPKSEVEDVLTANDFDTDGKGNYYSTSYVYPHLHLVFKPNEIIGQEALHGLYITHGKKNRRDGAQNVKLVDESVLYERRVPYGLSDLQFAPSAEKAISALDAIMAVVQLNKRS